MFYSFNYHSSVFWLKEKEIFGTKDRTITVILSENDSKFSKNCLRDGPISREFGSRRLGTEESSVVFEEYLSSFLISRSKNNRAYADVAMSN